MKTKTLSVDELVTDADTQSRIAIHEETVDDYAEKIQASKEWPMGPIDVFHDGNRYYVADGFHRTMAAQRSGRASVPCRIHKGTATDAKIFGMTANDTHGLRMSRADKRACVEWLLENEVKWSQAKVAETAGVSVRTVKYIVAERKLPTNKNTGNGEQKVQIAPSGKQATQDRQVSSEPSKVNQSESNSEQSAPQVEPPQPKDQAANNRKLARDLIDRAVRAVDDLHAVSPNHNARNKIVKMLQDAWELLW